MRYAVAHGYPLSTGYIARAAKSCENYGMTISRLPASTAVAFEKKLFPLQADAERLMASPHFGERWAREWLDAARYADSAGYEKDLPRHHHFYRDWVVAAMNSNMPYNDFIIKQIAGDLLPGATQDDRIATGFLRNSMTNEEGGAKPEQFRIEGVIDRIDAIGKSVLGLTAQCAQCHTHKYDPLTHDEYFGMFAFLNGVEETSIAAHTTQEKNATDALLAEIMAIDEGVRKSSAEVESAFTKWQSELLALPRTEWHALELYQLGDSGQKYWPLPDKSVINMGYAATRGSESFTSSLEIPEIRSARLEVMNDPYLPMNGPGRSSLGTGALTEFVLNAGADPAKLTKLPFTKATASVNPPVTPLDPMRFPATAERKPDERTTGPAAFAAAAMAASSSTSSAAVVMLGPASVASNAASRSVATTRAPSAAMASAVARPMPWPAAVTKQSLPANLPAMMCFLPLAAPNPRVSILRHDFHIAAWRVFNRVLRRPRRHLRRVLPGHPAMPIGPPGTRQFC
jgi:hypothetical protein